MTTDAKCTFQITDWDEKTYQEIKANWNMLAQDKYPQLRELTLP